MYYFWVDLELIDVKYCLIKIDLLIPKNLLEIHIYNLLTTQLWEILSILLAVKNVSDVWDDSGSKLEKH